MPSVIMNGGTVAQSAIGGYAQSATLRGTNTIGALDAGNTVINVMGALSGHDNGVDIPLQLAFNKRFVAGSVAIIPEAGSAGPTRPSALIPG